MKLKDEALLYIYLIEWAIILSTSMVTGIVSWSLMLRRRSYREVTITRMAKIAA